MPIRKSVTISLSPELLAVAEGLLASGRFGNISEVMRTALRQLEERELDFQAHRDARIVVRDRESETNGPKGAVGA